MTIYIEREVSVSIEGEKNTRTGYDWIVLAFSSF